MATYWKCPDCGAVGYTLGIQSHTCMFEGIVGYAEAKDGHIVVGNLGLKFYKRKKDLVKEGFKGNEIVKVIVKRVNQ